MGDLVNIARADEPHARLERIYEWYFARTMNAIRVASVAAGGVAAAIYGLAVKRPPCTACEGLLSSGLTAAAIVCVVAGIAQRRELAQLHTELARAHGLLAELSAVSKERLAHIAKAPAVPAKQSLSDHGLIAVAVVSVAATGFAVGWGQKPLNALEALAVLVALLGSLHVAAEVWRYRPGGRNDRVNNKPATDTKRAASSEASKNHGSQPSEASEDDESDLPEREQSEPEPRLTAAVDVRLDDFVMLPSVRKDVLDAIKYEVKTYPRPAE